MSRFLTFAALLFWVALPATAHELRPSFLDIQQTESTEYAIRFKVPARGEMRLALRVRLPDDCTNLAPPRSYRAGEGIIDQLRVSCPAGLDGREIMIDGLASTYTDVVVRAARADGSVQTMRATPDQPAFTIASSPSWQDTARTYFLLGFEHILLGLDHLLFVSVLLLLVRDRWMLVKTITAFTVAHSITLAIAALGFAAVPQAPVEAVIALSIAFVAAEVLRKSWTTATVAAPSPWVMAFAFGLLHGLGFGGALEEIGLPQTDVPLALVSFNVGVEAAQLLFIAAVLACVASADRLLALRVPWLPNAVAYGIGSLAATWFIQRLSVIV